MSFESEVNTPNAPYVGNPNAISQRHYLTAGGQVIGVLISAGALPTLAQNQLSPTPLASITLVKVEFWHKDHLGSTAATTDHNGALTARYQYDPFGKRRFTNGTYDANGTLIVDFSPAVNYGTDRGFTGHEHLDDVGIVHMNGRLFDPKLGLFMQADPFISTPGDLQNYNRYGYCLNNPLTCTDPSGYWHFFGHNILPGIFHNKTIMTIASIAVAVYLPGSTGLLADFGITNVVANAAVTGFISGAVATGNIEGALQGAFTAGAFAGAGNFLSGVDTFGASFKDVAAANALGAGAGKAVSIALHGVVGCVTSAASGGKCGSGALSAAFSEAATSMGCNLTGRRG